MAVIGRRADVADPVPDVDSVSGAGCPQPVPASTITTDDSGARVGSDSATSVRTSLHLAGRRSRSHCSTSSSAGPAPRVRANAIAAANRRPGLRRMWINIPHGPSARNLPNGHLPNGHCGGVGYLSSSEDEGRALRPKCLDGGRGGGAATWRGPAWRRARPSSRAAAWIGAAERSLFGFGN
jgi:hypothetical protein